MRVFLLPRLDRGDEPIMRSHLRSATTLLAVILLAAGSAGAGDDDGRHGYRHDHDRARAALERGEVRPIGDILANAAAEVPGEVVEVELERERGRWVYEIKVITPDGHVMEVLMDAATATVMQVEDY
jgi:uncharacterized membrane protein YkoI